MKTTKNHRECQEKTKRIQDRISVFFDTYHVGTLLNHSGVKKVRVTSPLIIIKSIFGLPFYGVNFFRGKGLWIQATSGSNAQVNRPAWTDGRTGFEAWYKSTIHSHGQLVCTAENHPDTEHVCSCYIR